MHLIMNGINNQHLRDILEYASRDTEKVLAAVAYATDARLLFDWCFDNRIPLTYYGRLDANIAVKVNILNKFLKTNSPDHVCKLVQHHHAKVIWWRGVGLYIGSANLTDSAWYKNIEAGCYFEEKEISNEMKADICKLFDTLETNSTPLTEDVVNAMQERSKKIENTVPDAKEFWQNHSFKLWDGLIKTTPKKDRQSATSIDGAKFLEEWRATLQILWDIGRIASQPNNRPSWIDPATPESTQTDQFLHAFYLHYRPRGKDFEILFEENKGRKSEALAEALAWWKDLEEAPRGIDEMIHSTAPFLQNALSQEAISNMDQEALYNICNNIHSIKGRARFMRRAKPNKKSNIEKNLEAITNTIWCGKSGSGKDVKQLLNHILYDGPKEQLPERLWQGMYDPAWKMDGLSISSLGEIVGWALPNDFPPRNRRTSRALKSLGYDVTVH